MTKGRLATFSTGLRRAELAMGLGLVAVALGGTLSAWLIRPLAHALGAHRAPGLVFSLQAVLAELWAYAVLPPLAFVLAKVMPMNPWAGSAGALVTGAGFVFAARQVIGDTGLPPEPFWAVALRLLLLSLGLWLTKEAVRISTARGVWYRQEGPALARTSQDEYEELRAASERTAARHEAAARPPAVEPAPEGGSAQAPEAPGAEAPSQAPPGPNPGGEPPKP